MKKQWTKKVTSWILCMVLVVAMALFTTGCNDSKETGTNDTVESEAETPESSEAESTESGETEVAESSEAEIPEGTDADVTVLGEGSVMFSFTVTDKDGNETAFEIHTDKENVGDALLEVELIAGDESEYGLYVKTVNGITADYDVDGTYWAFYIDGEYAMTGVDATPVTEGAAYAFKVE